LISEKGPNVGKQNKRKRTRKKKWGVVNWVSGEKNGSDCGEERGWK